MPPFRSSPTGPTICPHCGCPHPEVMVQTLRCGNPFCRYFHPLRADQLHVDQLLVRHAVLAFVYAAARHEAGKGSGP